jgi:hypothetical protein
MRIQSARIGKHPDARLAEGFRLQAERCLFSAKPRAIGADAEDCQHRRPVLFTFPGTSLTVHRIGYGAMQLAGPGVWGPPKDPDGAVAVLREAVAAGVNHIDTSDFYGPHVTNQIIRQALHPYPAGLVIVTKLGARRPPDKSWQPAISPED